MARVTVASELSLDVARSTTRAVAASRTDVPQTLATAMSTDSSGRQASDHPSLNVPVPLVRAGVPQSIPSTRSRCSSRDRARSLGLRRSSSSALSSGSIASRSRRAVARRSASSGTVGASSGTVPRRSPTTTSRVTSSTSSSSP